MLNKHLVFVPELFVSPVSWPKLCQLHKLFLLLVSSQHLLIWVFRRKAAHADLPHSSSWPLLAPAQFPAQAATPSAQAAARGLTEHCPSGFRGGGVGAAVGPLSSVCCRAEIQAPGCATPGRAALAVVKLWTWPKLFSSEQGKRSR